MGATASRLKAVRTWTRDRLGRSLALRIVLIVLGSLLVIGVLLDRGLDGPLRRLVERRMNESLVGYSARLGHLDFHLVGLSMDLEALLVSQDAHPDPPVLSLPRLRMSVHWRDVLRFRLVADALFESPTIHADLAQLQSESQDSVPIQQRGWQSALESIYPLKINELRIVNGTLVYQDDSGVQPLHISGVEFLAGNIRNIRSRERQYPSTLHAEGRVFDVGRVLIDGRADFLAEPTPGVKGTFDLKRVELSYFEPIARRFGLNVKQGFVSGSGMVEYAPKIQSVDLDSVVISDAVIDYSQGSAPTREAQEAGHRISQVAQASMNNPEVLFKVRHLLMDHGTLGVINTAQKPAYRLYFSNAEFELTNLSSRAEDGPAQATLRGDFMGSGAVDGNATFHPEGKHANFEAKVAIKNTQLKSLNDLLRAKGNFDVTEGTLSVYTEVHVREGFIDGYVKPLFRDVKVYDSAQDKHKNLLQKSYEGIVGGVTKMLENRKGEVATVASLKGPVDNPNANTFQVLGGLLRNAFVKAILPGFQHQLALVDPMRFRSVKKQERKDEQAALRR